MNRKLIKKIVALLILCLVIAFLPKMENKAVKAKEELTGKTSTEIVAQMGKGFNIGNTLDATGGNSNVTSQETSWGNPVVTRDLIKGIAEAGFKTVRIPTTWAKHISSDYTVDEEMLSRVKEIIDWCYEFDLYIILNLHHENWINVSNIDTTYEQIGDKLFGTWSSIADYFADYDQHLIFEGMNEPRAVNTSYEWNGNSTCYAAINYLNQLFVNAVRGNGKGHNNERALMIPGYAASSSRVALAAITIPTFGGAEAENLVIAVHSYSPYNLCLSDAQSTFNPNSSADTSDLRRLMKDLKELFQDKGYPVVLGEVGCTNTNDNLNERIKYFNFLGRLTEEAGVPAVLWDNGHNGKSGGECHNYFVRKTGEQMYPELLEAFIYGRDYGVEDSNAKVITFEPYNDGSSTVMVTPKDAGFTNNKLGCQMKINHTKDAKTGFAMKVDTSIENRTAVLDLKPYAGKNVKITAYVCSVDADNITMSFKVNGSVVDESKAGTSNTDEWKKLSVRAQLGEKDAAEVSFAGDAETTYYVDDIEIELPDENGAFASDSVVDTEDDNQGSTGEPSDTEAGTSNAGDDSNDGNVSIDSSANVPDSGNAPAEDSKINAGLIGGILAGVGIVGLLIIIVIKRKK